MIPLPVVDDGSERVDPCIQPTWTGRNSSQDWVIPLVKKLVGEGKKVIVFRNVRGATVACATYLAQALGLPPAEDTLGALPTGDPSVSSAALRRVLAGGVAFHNSDLDRDERLVLEEHFRERDARLRVMVATTTLAMGVNTPAEAVVIVELLRRPCPGGRRDRPPGQGGRQPSAAGQRPRQPARPGPGRLHRRVPRAVRRRPPRPLPGRAPGHGPVVDKDPLAPSALPTPDSWEWFSETGLDTAHQPKELIILPGGHFDAYTKGFEASSRQARDWFTRYLAA